MSNRRPSKKTNTTLSKQKFSWPWAIVGGALLLIIGGLSIIWASSDTAPPATPVVTGAPRLAVDQTTIDEGYVKLGTSIRTTFHLRNIGDEPLHILGEPIVELVEGC